MTGKTGKIESNIDIKYDEDTFTFWIQQEGYTSFCVNEAYLQRIVDAFLTPEEVIEPGVSLWNTFRVTELEQSLILERSRSGKSELLMKLSKEDAKSWAIEVESIHGPTIRSYVW